MPGIGREASRPYDRSHGPVESWRDRPIHMTFSQRERKQSSKPLPARLRVRGAWRFPGRDDCGLSFIFSWLRPFRRFLLFLRPTPSLKVFLPSPARISASPLRRNSAIITGSTAGNSGNNPGGILSAGPGASGPACGRGCPRSRPQGRSRHPFRPEERGLPILQPGRHNPHFFQAQRRGKILPAAGRGETQINNLEWRGDRAGRPYAQGMRVSRLAAACLILLRSSALGSPRTSPILPWVLLSAFP